MWFCCSSDTLSLVFVSKPHIMIAVSAGVRQHDAAPHPSLKVAAQILCPVHLYIRIYELKM